VDRRGHRGGRLPAQDLEVHRRLLALVAGLVNAPVPLIDGVHDVSEGGLGVALAEMSVRAGLGFRVSGIADHLALFGEGPSRVVLSVPASALAEVQVRVEAAGVGWTLLGLAGGDRLAVEGLLDVPVAAAVAAWRDALPAALEGRAGSGDAGR
jgi:phosphoribosylformylglycinamidine synthase